MGVKTCDAKGIVSDNWELSCDRNYLAEKKAEVAKGDNDVAQKRLQVAQAMQEVGITDDGVFTSFDAAEAKAKKSFADKMKSFDDVATSLNKIDQEFNKRPMSDADRVTFIRLAKKNPNDPAAKPMFDALKAGNPALYAALVEYNERTAALEQKLVDTNVEVRAASINADTFKGPQAEKVRALVKELNQLTTKRSEDAAEAAKMAGELKTDLERVANKLATKGSKAANEAFELRRAADAKAAEAAARADAAKNLRTEGASVSP